MEERGLERRGASLEHTLTITLSRGVLLLTVYSKGGRSALRRQGDWHRHVGAALRCTQGRYVPCSVQCRFWGKVRWGCSAKSVDSVERSRTWLKALGPGSLVPFLERMLCDLRFAAFPL